MQDVFEQAPAYCDSCEYLRHSVDGCYVTNPGLRKHQAQGTNTRDNGKQHTRATNVKPKVAHVAQYIVVNDNQPKKPNSSNLAQ